MKLYRLVYVSKTAKTVWYYTGQGMTATDGGWSQYDDDALTVEKNMKTLLQVMRLGGPRVTGNSLDDHYFIEERDSDSAWDWTQHTQPAGVEYKKYRRDQERGQLDLFAFQPDQVGDGWVEDRSASAVDEAIEPSSSASVFVSDEIDKTIEPSEETGSEASLEPDLTMMFDDLLSSESATSTSVSDSDQSADESNEPAPSWESILDDPTSVTNLDGYLAQKAALEPESTEGSDDLLASTSVPVRDQPEAVLDVTASDEAVSDDSISFTDLGGMDDAFADLMTQKAPISAMDREQAVETGSQTADDDSVEEMPTDNNSTAKSDISFESLLNDHDVDQTVTDSDTFDDLLPDPPVSAKPELDGDKLPFVSEAVAESDAEVDEEALPVSDDEGGHDFTDLLDDEVAPANEVQPSVALDKVTVAMFEEFAEDKVDQAWLGYLIRQGAMLNLWTSAATSQLLATLRTDNEEIVAIDVRDWWNARPAAKPDNLTAWLQWGASLTVRLGGQDELSVYHHDLGAIAQLVSRALGVPKHSHWHDRVWTPLDRCLNRDQGQVASQVNELEADWHQLVDKLPISQAAKMRLMAPDNWEPVTLDDVKWQSVSDAMQFVQNPLAATLWLWWRELMMDMNQNDWWYEDGRYIYPATIAWLKRVAPMTLGLQPHDSAWEVSVDYLATFGFELVDRIARWLQAQNRTDQVLSLIKYWTKPERIGFIEMDFRAVWLNDLSREHSELRTSHGLSLWLEEQSPVRLWSKPSDTDDLYPVLRALQRYDQETAHWPQAWWQAWSQEWHQAGLIDESDADWVASWGSLDRFALTADLPWAQVNDDLDKHFYTSGEYQGFKITTDVAKDTPFDRVDMDLYDPRLVYQAIQYLQAALRQRKPAETMLNQLDGKIAQDMFHSLEMVNLSQLSDEQNREFLNLLQTTRRTRRQVKDLVLLLKALDEVFNADKLPKVLHQLDNTASANHYHFRSRDFADGLKQALGHGKQA